MTAIELKGEQGSTESKNMVEILEESELKEAID